ncbi:hypothetical protein HJA87_04015 [Rhizobium bangladeshense]|uniref:Uncharacterized protein n=1 Tax=Rhizobium bangladeshense TaxID=1138189 RepID=A0ABS7LCQ0_9HYPH|nr:MULTISPECIES: hypothetical protein [Rhizobium]MBX4867081.1 hypothetical protein [Rhizobium bangladeshense]MBX4874260.1 hypothetical protein [Rhizobium bangladeshense]MBX4883769.1 hypothetical protein [Rhizobium bangladeshense]MBX4888810.1 hypothetical protein [Rhizobium bangladeshense]MBX4923987.1 hypothetical protein [Rhizobium bangladeshense]
MQRFLLSGLALAASAATAFAQQPPASPPASPPAVEPPAATEPVSPPPPSAPDNEGSMRRGSDEPSRDRPDDRWHGSRGGMGFHGYRGHRMPPQTKAAHFEIEDGDTRIDLKCAEDEPMKVCADLLLQVIDRLQGQD